MNAPCGHNEHKITLSYNLMMSRIRSQLESSPVKNIPSLKKAVAAAQQQAISLGEITEDEAALVGQCLLIDIQDAADDLIDNTQAFSDWLLLDIDLLERRVIFLFFNLAEQTRDVLYQLMDENLAPRTE